MKKYTSYFLVISGAALWGLIGIFVQSLSSLGLSAMDIVAVRVFSAFLMMLIYCLIVDRSLLVIKLKDCFYFIGTGICSIVFFNWCYFTAINEMSISIAVILLYTAPAFVTILSVLFLKEELHRFKVIALVLTLLGCVFVTGYSPITGVTISYYGLLVGLGSGIGYALYTIFGKLALRKYSTITITTYTFLFASLSLIPSINHMANSPIDFHQLKLWGFILGLGFFPTVLAYFFYTKGLSNIESSKASIIATIEPIVATTIGVLLYHERLSVSQAIGIIIILAAVILVQTEKKKRYANIGEAMK